MVNAGHVSWAGGRRGDRWNVELMAARKTKTKLTPAPSGDVPHAGRLADAVTALERERSQLKKELAAAKARIAELEKARQDTLNRLDWAIDALQAILQRAE